MTSEEIKDLIASAIAGQGNQVDAGGKLAEILNALSDAVAEAPTIGKLSVTNTDLVQLFDSERTPTINDFVASLGTDVNGLCSALEKDVTIIVDATYQLTAVYKDLNHYQGKLRGAGVVFGTKFTNVQERGFMCYLSFDLEDETYVVDYIEI